MNWSCENSKYPVFTHNLWRLLQEKSNEGIVHYAEGKKSVFVIKDVLKFTHIILPRYYKMSQLQQYYNHLERYGFQRICDDPPKWYHEKWDKDNKSCLGDIPKVYSRSNNRRSIPHHMRPNVSLKSLAEKLDSEIVKRQALQRDVTELKTTVGRLMNIIEENVREDRKGEKEVKKSVVVKTTMSPLFPRKKRSLDSSSQTGNDPPKKKRNLKPNFPDITVPSGKGSNPFNNRQVISNLKLQMQTDRKSDSKPSDTSSDPMQSVSQIQTPDKAKFLEEMEVNQTHAAIPGIDTVSLKTEVLQANICWN